jgi:LPXTG-motif cell wall-anchored protein
MAVITTSAWSRTARRVLATGAVAGTALLALALPASAHTPKLEASCTDGKTTLTIDLKSYNGQKDNTVKATDGDTVLADTTFKSGWSNKFDVSATADHTFTVTVGAWDDKDGSHGYSFTKTLTVKACVVETTTTTTPPAETTTTTTSLLPTSTTSSEAPPVPSTTPAPPADQGGLASTGASVGLPLTIGALLLIGGGALLLVVRKRRNA